MAAVHRWEEQGLLRACGDPSFQLPCSVQSHDCNTARLNTLSSAAAVSLAVMDALHSQQCFTIPLFTAELVDRVEHPGLCGRLPAALLCNCVLLEVLHRPLLWRQAPAEVDCVPCPTH